MCEKKNLNENTELLQRAATISSSILESAIPDTSSWSQATTFLCSLLLHWSAELPDRDISCVFQLSNMESVSSMLRMAGPELVMLMCEKLAQFEDAAYRQRAEMDEDRIRYLTSEEKILTQLR